MQHFDREEIGADPFRGLDPSTPLLECWPSLCVLGPAVLVQHQRALVTPTHSPAYTKREQELQ